MRGFLFAAAVLSLVVSFPVGSADGAVPPGLDQQGKPDIKSAGPLAFGPPGVLFVGDPQGGALFALGVDLARGRQPSATLRVEAVDEKIAAALGAKPAEVTINDLAVQPRSGVIYLSATRGQGPAADPVLATVDAKGSVAIVSLDNVHYAKLSLTNIPGEEQKGRRGQSLRTDAITDINYVDGQIYVAGISEKVDSKIRGVQFPFTASDLGTSIEIYHGAHGRVESDAPVRTFVPFVVNGKPHLLAAYQCTPLVSFPLAQLKPDSKVRGKTVAELGNRNRPLDIISYEKDGRQYLLLANTDRGVMKINTDGIEDKAGIAEKINGTSGLNYETISSMKGVEQLDKSGAGHVVVLARAGDKLNLETAPLP